MPENRESGFSVYEFMIVICIITTVIMLMTPTISNISSTALRQRCMGNLRTLHQAFELYRQSNKGRYPRHKGGIERSILLLANYQSDLVSYLHCPAKGTLDSYSYDPYHSENDGDSIIFGDSSSYDELRDKAGQSDNHDGLGGFVLRVNGGVEYIFGCLYQRLEKYHRVPLIDNIYEPDKNIPHDTFLVPLDQK